MAISKELITLDDIKKTINTERQALTDAKQRIKDAVGNLSLLEPTFSGPIAEIQAYKEITISYEYNKEILSRLIEEYKLIVTDANIAVTDLGKRTEF